MQDPEGYDLGGNVTVIFEGIDFEDRTHRQIVSVECPASGSIGYGQYLDPQLLKDDPFSFLPDGFGPVNVILRFEENLLTRVATHRRRDAVHIRSMGPLRDHPQQ